MADSRLADALEYLEQLFTASAEADLDGVMVRWGPPPDDTADEKPTEFVAVGMGVEGESGDSTREWGPLRASGANNPLNEDLEIHIAIQVSATDGTDMKPTFLRSDAIAAAVEREIRADVSLGDILLKGAKLGRRRGRYFRLSDSRGHRVFLTLVGTARI